MIPRLLKRLHELHRENRKLRADLERTRGSAQSYMNALFANHKRMKALIELSEAHKSAAETYRVALEELKTNVGLSKKEANPPDVCKSV